MVAINFNLTNFNNVASFMNIFNGFDNDFEITSDGVLRQKNAPPCPFCGTKMNQNGYNEYTKKNRNYSALFFSLMSVNTIK
jgi:hypothetical protein